MAINARVLKKSINEQGDVLTTFQLVFPTIILPEVLTHREATRNTSSNRAVPFNKMVKAVKESPFIPIAWQKHHKGMQGSEYITDTKEILNLRKQWKESSLKAIEEAEKLNELGVTKQLCNRLLVPFQWTNMVFTISKQGLKNFFDLRCSKYNIDGIEYKSKKSVSKSGKKEVLIKGELVEIENFTKFDWFNINSSTAEIHIQELAEQMYDAYHESDVHRLKAGEWHIPNEAEIEVDYPNISLEDKIKVAISQSARTSYTTFDDGKVLPLEKHRELFDLLIKERHDSPLENVCRAMTEEEYKQFNRGRGLSNKITESVYYYDNETKGWCKNHKGFISARYFVENNIDFIQNGNR